MKTSKRIVSFRISLQVLKKNVTEKNGNIVGIGLGIPGPVTDDGTVLKCANIHWPVFNVKEKLFDLTGGSQYP